MDSYICTLLEVSVKNTMSLIASQLLFQEVITRNLISTNNNSLDLIVKMKYAIITATAILLGVSLYSGIQESHQPHIPEEVRAQFQQWKATENRLYSSPSEEEYRLTIFSQNLKMINTHNAAGHSHTLAINQFADMTKEEFLAKFTGGPILRSPRTSEPTSQPSIFGLPGGIDWTKKGQSPLSSTRASVGAAGPSPQPGL